MNCFIQICSLLLLIVAVHSTQRNQASLKLINRLHAAAPRSWQKNMRLHNHGRTHRHKPHVKAKELPENLRKKKISHFKVPNQKLCAKLSLKPHHQFLLLPWWFHFCEKYNEEELKKYDKNGVFYQPQYKHVLDTVNMFKKMSRFKVKLGKSKSIKNMVPENENVVTVKEWFLDKI